MFRPLSWIPVRYILRKAAKSQGFLDPIEIMARLRSLAQPSEVGEPIELLRAGVVFHARGLINSRVIQHNLDWVWPYWVERQYDPRDVAFTPRAFSVTHINLTHRNWTAVGYPDCDELPIVDPRGMLTPILDGWSVDAWLLGEGDRIVLPSRLEQVEQEYDSSDGLRVTTTARHAGLVLQTTAEVVQADGGTECRYRVSARDDRANPLRLVLALRPQNPEGVALINDIELMGGRRTWRVNNLHTLEFSSPVNRHLVSDYKHGDVFFELPDGVEANNVQCDVGLATAAALFDLDASGSITLRIPLSDDSGENGARLPTDAWKNERNQSCQFRCPDKHYEYLWEAAHSSLVLHSPNDVYPGPYTYKRFWFRDAAFIIHALLAAGLTDRARRAIDQFFARQLPTGYFRSQEGEWDSNGEVLWILRRYQLLTGLEIPDSWLRPIKKGARWIIRKLLDAGLDNPHAGLMPAGFSAEHLGPNDYYYWDDFWSIAGLEAARDMLNSSDGEAAREFDKAARRLRNAVDRSLQHCQQRLKRPAMPASPYRRLDAGAIGSIAAGYPLQLLAPDDERLIDCTEFLLGNCFIDNAFFQDMIHSGFNAYLTLQTAQVLLRAGDGRYLDLMDRIAALASDTGQWPEAIHPRTLGGCMGDGHHVWASAEWVLVIRNCFVREEGKRLILCSGIPSRWLRRGSHTEFGPAHTEFGIISLKLSISHSGQVRVEWTSRWHDEEPELDIALPGHTVVEHNDNDALLIATAESKAS